MTRVHLGVAHDGVVGILVLGTLPPNGASVVAMLSGLGVADVSDRLRPVDEEMLVALDDRRADGADLGQLVDRARRRLPAGPWVYGATALDRTLRLWRQGVSAPPVAIVVDSGLSSVVAQLTAWYRRTMAVAVALWERRARQMLDAVGGLEALVVAPSPGAAEQVGRFLEGVGLAPDWTGPDGPQGGRPPTAAPPRSSRLPVSQLSSSHAGLRDLLEHLHGEHHPLSTPALPPESPATAGLVDADRCYERQRRRWRAAEGADGAVRVLRSPSPAVDTGRVLALRRAVLGPQAVAQTMRCALHRLGPTPAGSDVPGAVQEALLLAAGGHSPIWRTTWRRRSTTPWSSPAATRRPPTGASRPWPAAAPAWCWRLPSMTRRCGTRPCSTVGSPAFVNDRILGATPCQCAKASREGSRNSD
jgi:hypothetical protein